RQAVADPGLRRGTGAAHLRGQRPLPDALALRAMRPRSADFVPLRHDPVRACRRRARRDRARRRRGPEDRERVLVLQLRRRRVQRGPRPIGEALQRRRCGVARARPARDARGSFVGGVGHALRRSVQEGGEATAQRLTRSIVELEDAIASLPADARAVADRLFTVSMTTGHLDAPPAMHAWITQLFGSVEAVRAQRIVRVTNNVTLEGALFNDLRAMRPMEVKGADEVRAVIAGAADDPFAQPLQWTPADPFGRITGGYGIPRA